MQPKSGGAKAMTNAATLQDLGKLWSASAKPVPADQQTQALLLGRNFRINFKAALLAAAHTATLAFRGVASVANPLEALEIGMEVFSTVSHALSAVQEKVGALQYIACMRLCEVDGTMTYAELAQKMNERLDNPKFEYPWYIFMSKARLEEARRDWEDLKKDGAALARALANAKLCTESNGRVTYVGKHAEWGFADD
jgi:hypothetical protein